MTLQAKANMAYNKTQCASKALSDPHPHARTPRPHGKSAHFEQPHNARTVSGGALRHAEGPKKEGVQIVIEEPRQGAVAGQPGDGNTSPIDDLVNGFSTTVSNIFSSFAPPPQVPQAPQGPQAHTRSPQRTTAAMQPPSLWGYPMYAPDGSQGSSDASRAAQSSSLQPSRGPHTPIISLDGIGSPPRNQEFDWGGFTKFWDTAQPRSAVALPKPPPVEVAFSEPQQHKQRAVMMHNGKKPDHSGQGQGQRVVREEPVVAQQRAVKAPAEQRMPRKYRGMEGLPVYAVKSEKGERL